MPEGRSGGGAVRCLRSNDGLAQACQLGKQFAAGGREFGQAVASRIRIMRVLDKQFVAELVNALMQRDDRLELG